jgi:hypothetical protein
MRALCISFGEIYGRRQLSIYTLPSFVLDTLVGWSHESQKWKKYGDLGALSFEVFELIYSYCICHF